MAREDKNADVFDVNFDVNTLLAQKTENSDTNNLGITSQEELANLDKTDNSKSIENIDDNLDVNSIFEKQTNTAGEKKNLEVDDTTNKKTETPAPDIKDSSSPIALVLATYLKEQGVFNDNIDEKEISEIIKTDGQLGAIAYMFNKQKEEITNQIVDELEDDIKNYVQLRGFGIDPKVATEIASSKYKFENLTPEKLEEDENARKQVLFQNYKNTTNWSDERINKEIKNKIALGEDIDDAKEAIVEIKKYNSEKEVKEKETTKQQELARQQEYQKATDNLKAKIMSTEEYIPGKKINKVTKEKIFDMLTKPVARDAKGNPITEVWNKRQQNPIDFDQKLAYLIHIGLFDGKTDSLIKSAKTKAADDLERILSTGRTLEIGNVNAKTSFDREDDSDAILKQMQIFKKK